MISKKETKIESFIYEPIIKQNNIKPQNTSPSKSTPEIKKNTNKIINNNEDFIIILEQIKKCHPKIFGNYEILNDIEKGSGSYIMRIRPKKSNIELILKYNKNKNKNEHKIASKLKNQNVINLLNYNYSKENMSEIMIMENGRFGNLRFFMKKIIKKYVFSETMLCYLANEVIKGLLYCHISKVAHMDIKPQNIVLDDYFHAKLIDFSISIDYKNTKPKEKIKLPSRGTKPFMPLEVINGEYIEYENINKIDSYQLGVMIYYLAFGTFPYGIQYGDEIDIIKQKIVNNELNFKDKKFVSKYFIEFLEKLLKKNIKERISIFEAVNNYWIKGGSILYDEKEKIYHIYSYITHLMIDGIKDFNDYISK